LIFARQVIDFAEEVFQSADYREDSMDRTDLHLSRRDVLMAAAAAAGAAAVPLQSARAAAKYTRPNVNSEAGKRMLVSYAKGVQAMLDLPAEHPQNWFRNAFIHMMDCPHGNWWFYVWHRGYIGYFERTIRTLSGDPDFALPYWDWTQLPQIPDGMFDGPLTPTDSAYLPYTGNLARFSDFVTPALTRYWDSLSPDQLTQLSNRGYKTFDDMWNDVTGYIPPQPPPPAEPTSGGYAVAENQAFCVTSSARYLSRDNPKLDDKTAVDVSLFMIIAGLLPKHFNEAFAPFSFTSAKTPSHNTAPPDSKVFSLLEGFPHNKTHNYLGGFSRTDPGPYGNMTNNLSPIDPIFFLHHANMDRLWDVWTRKQMRERGPIGPADPDAATFNNEPFLFYVGGDGKPVGPAKAGDYFDMSVFDYDYEPGSGEEVIPKTGDGLIAAAPPQPIQGSVAADVGKVAVPAAAVRGHLAATGGRPLVAQITLPQPSGPAPTREFDILVNAPEGVTQVSADSPYYAGTFALFGAHTPGMHAHGDMDLTFAVPLPKTLRAFTELGAAAEATLNIRVVPSDGQNKPAVALKAVSLATQ
jgi:tyrosinase